MDRRFLVAAVQLNSGPEKEQNRRRVDAAVREAGARGAALIVLPEIFFWRGPRAEERDAAEPIPGPATDHLSTLARELGIYLLGGSILERAPGHEKVFNTSTLFDPKGNLIARYRKLHLFDVDLPGQVTIRESDTRMRGEDTVVVPTDLGKIGLSVCYDLRFPELFRRLGRDGAEIICLPSAFTFPTGAAHWEVLVRARAIENQVYMVAPNQIGRSAGGFNDYGNSLIVDPWGTPVARAPDRQTVILAEVDRDHLDRVRRELPCLGHAILPR